MTLVTGALLRFLWHVQMGMLHQGSAGMTEFWITSSMCRERR